MPIPPSDSEFRILVRHGDLDGLAPVTRVAHAWSFDVPANVSGPNGGTPAMWKNGKVAVNVGGNASDAGFCDDTGCYGHGIGINFDQVLKIS